MAKSSRDTSLANRAALSLLWAIGFDDDNIADYLQGLAALQFSRMMGPSIDRCFTPSRRAKVVRLEADLRAGLIQEQRAMNQIIEGYLEEDGKEREEIPF